MIEWLKLRRQQSKASIYYRWFTADGLRLSTVMPVDSHYAKRAAKIDRPDLDGLIAQVDDEGLLEQDEAGYLFRWGDLYSLLESEDYGPCREILSIFPASDLVPEIRSYNTLIDHNFSIFISNWHDGAGLPVKSVMRTGGILSYAGKETFAPKLIWELCEEVEAFAQRPETERNEASQRRAWGRLRKKAKTAGARMDQFLQQSIVLTPEKIDLAFRKAEGAGERVIELIPGFSDAPEAWLETFDKIRNVQPYYQINSPNGITHVMVSDNARAFLGEIKKMPGRLIAGERAEALLINPVAALGEVAASAIDIEQFTKSREEALIQFSSFTAHIKKDAAGNVVDIGLDILTASQNGMNSETVIFVDTQEAEDFIRLAQNSIKKGRKLIPWKDYEIEVRSETDAELQRMSGAVIDKMRPRILIEYADVYDLSRYSQRIVGIGEEKPIFSTYIAKLDKKIGWFPENILPIVTVPSENNDAPLAYPIDQEFLSRVNQGMAEAHAGGFDEFQIEDIQHPIPVKDAENITRDFEIFFKNLEKGLSEPPGNLVGMVEHNTLSAKTRKPERLIMTDNIGNADYIEPAELTLGSGEPILPSSLSDATKLKDHQRVGVAWLQSLFKQSPAVCRGCVFADDMGLGKTLQLLTTIASVLEADENIKPILVVAPVSLLENWQEEVKKFFKPGTFRVLVAYGSALKAHMAPRESIDEQLRSSGIVKFLEPGWIGEANLVLTTYETLRDLEFSFAAQKWSMMICDEAQKIKTPSSAMTRAAKKQNARFKIACTGTPVENSLVDLWCLFDFVQPGFLGALNEFSATYRKPIEAQSDQEKSKTEELRSRIKPYILRRTKQEVAKDLPKKISVPSLINLSKYQRNFYIQALSVLPMKDGAESKVNSLAYLEVLHKLRMICIDPRRFIENSFVPDNLRRYSNESPKLHWLIDRLEDIKTRGEKVILFCEFKEVQRMLHHFIQIKFGISPSIINGDTSATSKGNDSRQKRITRFQQQVGFGVIILSPVAVGFGVNIQAANHVIHYSRTWNPAKEDQATDRAYRIGQTRDVSVYCPTVRADDFDTFEVQLDKLLGKKRELATDMLNGAGDINKWEIFSDRAAPKESNAIFFHRITGEALSGITGDHFEALVQVIWEKLGYEVRRVGGPGDGGIDLVAFKNMDECLFIQCKASSFSDKKLGWEAIKDVSAGENKAKRSFPGFKTYRKLAATNQAFNSTAKEQALLNCVELIERNWLSDSLEKHEITTKDLLINHQFIPRIN